MKLKQVVKIELVDKLLPPNSRAKTVSFCQEIALALPPKLEVRLTELYSRRHGTSQFTVEVEEVLAGLEEQDRPISKKPTGGGNA